MGFMHGLIQVIWLSVFVSLLMGSIDFVFFIFGFMAVVFLILLGLLLYIYWKDCVK